MPILYPASLDSLTNPTSSDTLDGVPHAAQHGDANDAIEALETKLGTGASVPATVGHALRVTGPGATAFGQLAHSELGAVGANDHHSQAHAIDGADHTASGLTAGHVLRATAATTFAFGALQESDIPATIARDSELTAYQLTSEKAAANGYASLDAAAKVPVAQIRSINAGTAFPASPTANDTFFRTDTGLEYYWSGTQWLSLQRFTTPAVFRAAIPLSANDVADTVSPGNQAILVVGVAAEYFVNGTNDVANRWNLNFQDDTTTSFASHNTDATAASTWGRYSTHALSSTYAASPMRHLQVAATKTGTPGTLFVAATIFYRLIGA